MNVKLPKLGWSDGTHCRGFSVPDRSYVPIVPVRYRRGAIVRGNGRSVDVLGVHHCGYIVGVLCGTDYLHYFTHAQLEAGR